MFAFRENTMELSNSSCVCSPHEIDMLIQVVYASTDFVFLAVSYILYDFQ